MVSTNSLNVITVTNACQTIATKQKQTDTHTISIPFCFRSIPTAIFLESVTISPPVSWVQPHEEHFLPCFLSVLTLHIQFSGKSFCVIMLKRTLLLLSFHWVTNSKKNICCQRLIHLQRKWCCSNAKVLMNSCSCQGRAYIWIMSTHEPVWLSIKCARVHGLKCIKHA